MGHLERQGQLENVERGVNLEFLEYLAQLDLSDHWVLLVNPE